LPSGKRSQVLIRARGRCEKCGKDLQGIHPPVHHKDGDPSNNDLSNLIALCPNCHSKIGLHESLKPKREKSFDEEFTERMKELDNGITGLVYGTSKKRKKKSGY